VLTAGGLLLEIVFLASFEIVLAFVYAATSFSIETEVPRAA
jgi:hypothetical protein